MARMVFRGADRALLAGAAFSPGHQFRTRPTRLQTRADALADWSRGRSVLHVGFADHLPQIAEKRAAGTWLHDRLTQVATRVVGIDTNDAAVAYCESLGIKDIHSGTIGDVVSMVGLDHQFDVVILGEMLEHVGDPVSFLHETRISLEPLVRDARLVVTVPNAWDVETVLFALRGREYINTDHRFTFTPFTIAKVLTDAGFEVLHVDTVNGFVWRRSPQGMLLRSVTRRFGLMRTGLLAVAAWPSDNQVGG